MTTLFYPLNWGLSLLASVLRLGAGGAGTPERAPAAPLILYEFEGCPFCRIAREQVSATGVTVHVKPCPKGGRRFRPEVREKGGKAQFPYLIDPNTDKAMYESADIARTLRRTYGGARPLIHWTGPVSQILSQCAVLARYLSGTFARPSNEAAAQPPERPQLQPQGRIQARIQAQPLHFSAPERSPGGRLVKEMLCARELDYLWTPRAPGGQPTPFLEDPNTGTHRAGGLAILRYLSATYPRAR